MPVKANARLVYMPAPKGHSKWGGRQKGTPNKRTSDLAERLELSGKDPFDTMIDLLDHSDPGVRLSAAKELAQYVRAKRKAVEMKLEGDVEHAVSEELKSLFSAWLKLAKGERGKI